MPDCYNPSHSFSFVLSHPQMSNLWQFCQHMSEVRRIQTLKDYTENRDVECMLHSFISLLEGNPQVLCHLWLSQVLARPQKASHLFSFVAAPGDQTMAIPSMLPWCETVIHPLGTAPIGQEHWCMPTPGKSHRPMWSLLALSCSALRKRLM